MSTSAALADKYAHIERDIVRALKSTLQKVPVEISAYVTADFEEVTAKPQTERGAKGLRKAKSGLLYWNTTNPTSNLRRATSFARYRSVARATRAMRSIMQAASHS